MHRALQISEVYQNILDSFRAGSPRKKLRHGLLCLALVCKAFHEPALDLLWTEIFRFEILLGTFPEDVWDGTEKKVSLMIRVAASARCDRLVVFRSSDVAFARRTLVDLTFMQKESKRYIYWG